MGDDGEGDGGAHAAADLEGGAQRDAVHEAVTDHRGGRRHADLRDPLVGRHPVRGLAYGEESLHDMGEEEAADEEQQGLRDTEDLVARRLQGLGQQVESDDAEHESMRRGRGRGGVGR